MRNTKVVRAVTDNGGGPKDGKYGHGVCGPPTGVFCVRFGLAAYAQAFGRVEWVLSFTLPSDKSLGFLLPSRGSGTRAQVSPKEGRTLRQAQGKLWGTREPGIQLTLTPPPCPSSSSQSPVVVPTPLCSNETPTPDPRRPRPRRPHRFRLRSGPHLPVRSPGAMSRCPSEC